MMNGRKRLGKHLMRLLALVLVIAVVSPTSLGSMAEAAAAAKIPELTISTTDILIGEKLTIGVKNKISGSKYAWVSSNKKIATVNSKGVVTAVKTGTAAITCKVTAPRKTYTLKGKVKVVDKVTVATQTQLNKALKNKNLSRITIKTEKAVNFTIPAGTYTKTLLLIDAPKSDVTNSARFKTIVIDRIKENTFTEKGKGNTFNLRAPAARLVIAKGAEVNNISLRGQKADIVVDGDVRGKITYVKGASAASEPELILSGETDTPVEVVINNSDAKLTTAIKTQVSVNTHSTTLTFEKGSEGSAVVKANDSISVNIENKTDEKIEVKIEKESEAQTGTPSGGNSSGSGNDDKPIKDNYTLVWEENFNGNSLGMDDWTIEQREPGWVNEELQRYTDSEENIYVKDGKLVLKANKTEDGDNISYTSGKVTTQWKHEFKYGRFEIKAKVPEGQGLWPAIWMMPTNENLYGQWPRCGEIDIMEVLGHQTEKTYGTIHYGNPHEEQQGTYTLPNGRKFSDDYHVYTCEWLPDEIRFYIDGKLFHTANDWFTRTEGQGEITFPAPFDQPFYLQLNMAVGGSWPGNPDETTNFDDAKFEVDYVKVYQLDSYNEDVPKPVKEVILRDPDENGNYINNGDFSIKEELDDDSDWVLLTALGGEAEAGINESKVVVKSTAEGTENYSIQLVQANVPLKKGDVYKLSYEAKASENRTIITNVTAPDRSYKRYFADTTVDLTNAWKTYEHEFTMTDSNDANGRLEFNLGKQGSTADVEIRSVKLERIDHDDSIENPSKTILADGNYVYNGAFQEGDKRLGYWEIINNCNASVTVTNINNERELKVSVPDSVESIDDVIVKQTDLAIKPNKEYKLSFDARGEEEKTIKVTINEEEYEAELTGSSGNTRFEFILKTEDELKNNDLEFKLGVPGTTYIDNVRLTESGRIINGDFSNGLTGYEVFVEGSIASKVSYRVDSIAEEAEFTIEDVGDVEWKIQLIQRNVTLEEGKWYKLSFDAKSNINREIIYALQKDGIIHNDDWTPYSGSMKIDLDSEYQTFEKIFKMNYATDEQTLLSISMGSPDGNPLASHKVWIDNIVLEEIEEPEESGDSETNIIKDGNFSEKEKYWTFAISEPGEADYSFEDNKATFTISNVGTKDWNIQLKQSGLSFEQGSEYKISMKLISTETRIIKIACMGNASKEYAWYGGDDIILEANSETTIERTFRMNETTDLNSDFVISMGKIENEDTKASIITVSDVKIIKVDPNMIKNGNFSEDGKDWIFAISELGEADYSFGDNKATFTISNVGTKDWNIQLKQSGLSFEQGSEYKISMKLTSTVERTVKIAYMSTSYAWYGGDDITLEANSETTIERTFQMNETTDLNSDFVLSMGKIEGEDTKASTITVSEIKIIKIN